MEWSFKVPTVPFNWKAQDCWPKSHIYLIGSNFRGIFPVVFGYSFLDRALLFWYLSKWYGFLVSNLMFFCWKILLPLKDISYNQWNEVNPFTLFSFQLSSLSFVVENRNSKEKSPQPLFHFARRGLASASEDGRREYIEVERQQPRKLDLAYLKAMMNLPPQDLQPLTQLQKMARVAQNSLVYEIF